MDKTLKNLSGTVNRNNTYPLDKVATKTKQNKVVIAHHQEFIESRETRVELKVIKFLEQRSTTLVQRRETEAHTVGFRPK